MPIISKMTHTLNTIPIEIPGEQTFFGGFPGGTSGKESACDAGDQGSIPGLGSFSGEANGNPLQYSCLENSRAEMDREAWRATIHGVAKSQTGLRH